MIARDQTNILRRLHPSDADIFFGYSADPDVAQYQSWEAMDRDEAVEFLTHMQTVTPLMNPSHWVQIGVTEGETNTLIGDMGWHLSADGNEVELGITLAKEHHKKGHATRAIRMAMRDVLSATKADRIIAYADLRNWPSRALMQRVGFTSLGQQTHERVVEEVFEFLRVTPPN